MKIHIIGAGPTGMSLAWEILRSGDHDVTIYDRKVSAGGSWWEPDVETRDLHAHRICLLYTSPSPRDLSTSRMPSSA